MAYKKKHKESATIRYRELADGRKSIYLDIRVDGNRQYRTLNLYLLPETDFLSKQKNRETLAQADKIKEETIIEKMYARAGLDDRSFLGHTTLVDWMQKYYDKQSAEEKSETSLLTILRLQNEIREFDPKITLEEVDLDFANNFAVGQSSAVTAKDRTSLHRLFKTFGPLIVSVVNHCGCVKG